MKQFICIICTAFLWSSCGKNNLYKVEGELSHLSDPVLYIAYESPKGSVFDTLQADKKGHFSVMREEIEDIQSATLFFEGKEKWFTFYPETGKTVKIKGDAQYPDRIQARVGDLNDQLNKFKSQIVPLLKKQRRGDSSADSSLELHRIAQNFIATNPNEKVSAILIAEYFADVENMPQAEELLNSLSPELNDFYVVKNLKSRINRAKMSMVGVKAPIFRVTNIYGRTFTQDSFLNKRYIFIFTNLWSDLSQTEKRMLNRISSEYSKDSLGMMVISLDNNSEKVLKLLKDDTISWNLIIDSAGQSIELLDKYNVNALPASLLMDKDGVIKRITNNSVELKQAVDKIFK